jgi:hypothetical protein
MNVAVSVPTDVRAYPHLFIGGEWVEASSGRVTETKAVVIELSGAEPRDPFAN